MLQEPAVRKRESTGKKTLKNKTFVKDVLCKTRLCIQISECVGLRQAVRFNVRFGGKDEVKYRANVCGLFFFR